MALESKDIKIGTPVYYKPGYGRLENGIIKSFSSIADTVFVVYNCGGNWEDYQNYTAASTRIQDLYPGWVDKDGRTPLHQELAKLKDLGFDWEL